MGGRQFVDQRCLPLIPSLAMRVPVQLCLAALATAGLLTACSGAPAAAPPGPDVSEPTPSPAASQIDEGPTAAATWSCDLVGNATIGSGTVAYEPVGHPITFSNGGWSGEDGSLAQIKACAVGDLDGSGPDDAVAAVEMSPYESNAEYWTLGVWHDTGGTPTFVTLLELGDRNPVETLDITGANVTVVWDTRGPTDAMTVLSIRRTSVYTLKAGVLSEASHTDAPYTA
jgi:hypothetical protein